MNYYRNARRILERMKKRNEKLVLRHGVHAARNVNDINVILDMLDVTAKTYNIEQ